VRGVHQAGGREPGRAAAGVTHDLDPVLALIGAQEGEVMFNKQKVQPPDRPFSHSGECKIVKADPGVQIPWNRLEYGKWQRQCTCGAEWWQEPAAKRTRQDPLDPSTFHHAGQCEFQDVSDPAIVKALLKIVPKDGYSWVECGACGFGWQVADYAEASVG